MGEGVEGEVRRSSHHLRSFWVPRGGVLGRKGLSSKIESIASRLLRYGRPSGTIWAACVNFPCNFCTSFRVCVRRAIQSWIALTYFTRLGSAKLTVRSLRSHVKPMKVGQSQNGISLDASQGIPSSCEMRSMSLMS